MPRSPTWLDVEHIERREEVLSIVQRLIDLNESSERTPAAAFHKTLLLIARRAVQEAKSKLSKARLQAAAAGAAPVDADTLEFVTWFNRIGPAKLRALVQDHETAKFG
jgi:hypothetical protein